MSQLVLLLLAVLFLSPLRVTGEAADSDSAIANPALAELKDADQLYEQGKLTEAIEKYRSALKISPHLEAAEAGLALALLAQNNPDDAVPIIVSGLAAHPKSAPLFVALGNANFRLAQIIQADKAYNLALQIDPANAQAYVGLFELYNASSMYARAYDALKRAHYLDRSNPDVESLWLRTLSRSERLDELQAYFASPRKGTEAERQLEAYLQYLQKTADQPVHACSLSNVTAQTETKLKRLHDADMDVTGIGLEVKIDNYDHVLLLDTGASGIVITPKAAAKAGLQRLRDVSFSGVGDQGEQSAYLALASRVVVGGLEFHDCLVTVADKKALAGADGLIGTDVFGSYLVDIDLPRKLLKLSALPRRPGEMNPTVALKSEGENRSRLQTPNVTGSMADDSLETPRDRYVDPTMANWTRFVRMQNLILVPVIVNGFRPGLFVVDTGSTTTLLSTRAARAVTNVERDKSTKVKGASGKVKNVYNANTADLRFGRFIDPESYVTSVDLTDESGRTGTEISGFLSFSILSTLEIRIDYRDGLIDFVYRDSHGVVH